MNRLCRRCGYDWKQRGASVPRQCPFCKSPKWNLERTAAALEVERKHWEPVED